MGHTAGRWTGGLATGLGGSGGACSTALESAALETFQVSMCWEADWRGLHLVSIHSVEAEGTDVPTVTTRGSSQQGPDAPLFRLVNSGEVSSFGTEWEKFDARTTCSFGCSGWWWDPSNCQPMRYFGTSSTRSLTHFERKERIMISKVATTTLGSCINTYCKLCVFSVK